MLFPGLSAALLVSLTLLLGCVAPAGQPWGLQHTPSRLPNTLVRLAAHHFPGLFQIQQMADREVLFGLEVVQVRRDRALQAAGYRGLPVHYMRIARSHDAGGAQRRGRRTDGKKELCDGMIRACSRGQSLFPRAKPKAAVGARGGLELSFLLARCCSESNS